MSRFHTVVTQLRSFLTELSGSRQLPERNTLTRMEVRFLLPAEALKDSDNPDGRLFLHTLKSVLLQEGLNDCLLALLDDACGCSGIQRKLNAWRLDREAEVDLPSEMDLGGESIFEQTLVLHRTIPVCIDQALYYIFSINFILVAKYISYILQIA